MKIQVNIISYGYAHLASHCIESALSQTRKPDKILVVDDGKHDGIEKMGIYPVEILIRENNLGIIENFNDVLMNRTNADKVMFLGADNYLRPDALELMDREEADIVSSDIALVGTEVEKFRQGLITEYSSGYHIWRFLPGDIDRGNYIHGSSLYRVDIAKKYGYKGSGGRHTEEDWMLWKQMITGGATHKHIPEPLLYYRRHKSNFNKI